MQLIMSRNSPYVRKVRVLIREAGQSEEVTEVEVSTSALATDPQVLAAHPTARIPVLIRDDGRAVHDSRVITRYLDERWGAGLYPADRLWDVLVLEATADGISDSAVGIAYETRLRPEDKQWTDWTEAHWAKIANALDMLDAAPPTERPLDMGKVALGCALGYLDFRHGPRNWREGRPALADWFAGFSERASMVATKPA